VIDAISVNANDVVSVPSQNSRQILKFAKNYGKVIQYPEWYTAKSVL
jgi:hypothetical protein